MREIIKQTPFFSEDNLNHPSNTLSDNSATFPPS